LICFADTDIILKLAACDLLPQTLSVLGVTRREVYVFKEEALRVYRYDQDVHAQYSEHARQRAIEFVSNVRSIYSEIDTEEQAYMLAAGIDTGEQAIFGATRDSIDFTVVTADRKALRKLAPAPGCGAICARMQGRVRSLDQILLLLIQKLGHEAILPMIKPHREHDIAFQEASAPGIDAHDAQAKLWERIERLRADTRGLLG
jgi:hypothetical protein